VRHLSRWARACPKGGHIVVISHAPPQGCSDSAVGFSPSGTPCSIGSTALRRFVLNDRRVRLVICGHVHREGGQSERLGNALVVNVASHDNPREPFHLARLELTENGDCRVGWHSPVAELRRDDDLRRVWGVDVKTKWSIP
jgi:Icc-related predicted phosphoesterase